MKFFTGLSLLVVSILFSAALFAGTVSAQAGPAPCSPGQPGCTNTGGGTTSGTFGNGSEPSFNLNIKLNNPLKVDTIQDAVKLFVNGVVRLAIPVLVLFYIWAGISFIFARGNPEKIKRAKDMFFYTIIGTLLILGAWAITNAIIGTINSIIE